ncbi:hypothetical protein GT037_007437 [Alternaria burnsii]|uniref:Uncharacterized protein n=1 Tax=Alternaria burnsii TaxID=1187904 RepID=A0A8H7B473_9PLEO|nr:uncharacterized protein GT037_007437 [Alternaria burnsii]KAF7674677.1 hypothetical protein GT037_007437 [Alternaria burnsii]CAI9625115.1 unnamed protein product [Alternaria burnsii]
MASAQSYSGPISLGHSKYADPLRRKAALAASASVAAVPTADTAMATKEQIAALKTGHVALDVAHHNADAQLAISQGNVLKEEVAKHVKKFSRTVSSTVTNTRRLLELIREALPDANTSTLNGLWDELEQLFAAANEAKEALPVFLEKQRDNMSLYHSSMVNEAIKDTQDELNIQHKKVNIQHNLILEHQEAFLAHKEQTSNKLKELEDLQERVSRLTLEKGNFRTEVDKYMQLLEEERSTKAEDLRKVTSIEKELETLVDSKKQLLAESDTLRKALQDVQAKMKSSEQEITDRFTTQLKSTADLLAKETQKTTALNTMINELKGGESTARLDADKSKKENKVLNEKYANQAAEHAQAFMKLNEQIKQIEGLKIDLERHQKENAELQQRLIKLANLEEQINGLSQEKSTLSEQVSSLSAELDASKNEENKANTKVGGLLKKVEGLDQEVEQLESAHNKLLNKMKENRMAVQTSELLKNENTKLKAMIDELKASKSTSSAVGGSSSPNDEETIRGQEKKIEDLEIALQEWTDLAKRSYKEYKEMLPTYKKADQLRRDVVERDATINKLELELAEAKVSKTNGVGAGVSGGNDVRYWKQKYEALLLTVDN